jgi:hypothetical protein
MHTTETFYAVEIPCVTRRTCRLAIGATAGPRLHYWRRNAVAFKAGLVSEGFKAARVVKVRVTYRWR